MNSPQAQISSIESVILPLLSICSLTSEYQKTENSQARFRHPQLNDIQELPSQKSALQSRVVSDCQKTFEKEANILIDNHMPREAVEELYINYKQFLVEKLYHRLDHSDTLQTPTGREDNDDTWLSNAEFTFDDSSSSGTDSFIFDMNDFDFNFATLTTSSTLKLPEPLLEFDQAHLCNGPDFLFSDYIHFDDEYEKKDPLKANDFYSNGKRKRISKGSRNLLEALFSVKKFPNSAERKLIADKCQMSPSQVRIWFTNKRARSKDSR